MAKYQIVNGKGLKEIHAILAERHKLGGDHFDEKMLCAWAEKVEESLTESGRPGFELLACETVSGHTEYHHLSDDAIEWAGEDDE